MQVNIEQGNAILVVHSFECELAMVRELNIFGSINIYSYDYQFGWGMDQFPNIIPEITLAHYEVLNACCFTAGRIKFDLKLR